MLGAVLVNELITMAVCRNQTYPKDMRREDGRSLYREHYEGEKVKKYKEFIKSKQMSDVDSGFEVPLNKINNILFDFQKHLVRWAIKRGRAAIFADTGLGKTAMQLEWASHVAKQTDGNILILAPLCVAQQTVSEGRKFGILVNYCRSQESIKDGINITNYEMLEHFDISKFSGIVLDESSILKSQDGKTRKALIESCQYVPYRLSCTATPSPNDYMELGNQAEFLGVMTMPEMLAMFFVHDGGDTAKWRLKGHGEEKFWEWLSTWAVVIRKPSDLGFDDAQYDLPPLHIHEHIIETDRPAPGQLFALPAVSLSDQRAAKRESLADRVEALSALVNQSKDQWLIWCHMNIENDALGVSINEAVTVSGSDTFDFKEQSVKDFLDNKTRVMVSKPSMFGYGLNLQCCHNISFVGLDHSFESYYQAIRRCWRFGQTKPVNVHLFLSDVERPILDNIKRKEAIHDEISARMIGHMKNFMNQRIFGMKREKSEYKRDLVTDVNFTLYLGDCVDIISEQADNSIDYTIFSPPFSSLYTYSNSDRDMGNCRTHSEFYEHFRFLVGDLFRVTRPGRLLSFHCMNLPTSKQNDGFIGIRDFRGELIRMFTETGWIYHSEVCIWKDPVTAMQRTKALGLLHKQIKKDSAMSRQGIADYLVTMRKPGENTKPITHTKESFPVSVWQRYASPIWMDINQSRTLNRNPARENEDERHICPLQLDVIERAIELWTAPDDLILSPFAGIGSEGYIAIQNGRRFIGIELKEAYWKVAVENLKEAHPRQSKLL